MTRLMNVLCGMTVAASLVACGGDDTDNNTNNTNNNNTTNNTNNTNNNNNTGCDLTTVVGVQACMEGKTYLMAGADIPTHPNGFSRDVNFGASSQCIASTEIMVVNNGFQVATEVGTLTGAPMVGDVGSCDVNTPVGTPLTFNSTAVLIENVKADGTCFDISATYGTFTQEGRAKLSDDGSVLEMELYFESQATGSRCADGAVGDATVTLNNAAFAGDAVQVYRGS